MITEVVETSNTAKTLAVEIMVVETIEITTTETTITETATMLNLGKQAIEKIETLEATTITTTIETLKKGFNFLKRKYSGSNFLPVFL
jgi:hypothetical protein